MKSSLALYILTASLAFACSSPKEKAQEAPQFSGNPIFESKN
jgi:hypothetical protein